MSLLARNGVFVITWHVRVLRHLFWIINARSGLPVEKSQNMLKKWTFATRCLTHMSS